jgi:allophanate hydrolase
MTPPVVASDLNTTDIAARVTAAFARIAGVDRPEVWITLRPVEDVLADARVIERRLAEGEDLPLAGALLAVKDNIDVAGLPTTAACPAFAYVPTETATAVRRLTAAGAIVLGKTNLDQFATGLVGTRSPYGAVRNALDPAKVSGGSSSGSAVAVALGLADIGIGTDTAGSGRVPAAFNGIVGMKPTVGLVPTDGVVPACRSFDCVTAFATTLSLARQAVQVMAGRPFGPVADPEPVVAVPRDADLVPLSPAYRAAFDAVLARFPLPLKTVDISGMLAAARLLYDGALVAERHAAVGVFVDAHPGEVDPVVGPIIHAAGRILARDYVNDRARLDQYRTEAAATLAGCRALLLPTTPFQPTIDEVRADPVGLNTRLGTYTNFVNLLDFAAVAVPAGEAAGAPFGVTILTRAGEDQAAADIAARMGPDS